MPSAVFKPKEPEKPTETSKATGTRQAHLCLRSAPGTEKPHHSLGTARLQQSFTPHTRDAGAATASTGETVV